MLFHHHHHHHLSSAFHAMHRLDVFPQSSSSNSFSPMPTLSLVQETLSLARHIHPMSSYFSLHPSYHQYWCFYKMSNWCKNCQNFLKHLTNVNKGRRGDRGWTYCKGHPAREFLLARHWHGVLLTAFKLPSRLQNRFHQQAWPSHTRCAVIATSTGLYSPQCCPYTTFEHELNS